MRVESVRRGIEQFAIHVADDRFCDSREVRIATRFVCVAVGVQGHRVVVSELLEMRDAPMRVGRVAMKSAAELIEHAAGGDFLQRLERHRGKLRMPVEPMRQHELDRGEIVESRPGTRFESSRFAIVRRRKSREYLRAQPFESTGRRCVLARRGFELRRGLLCLFLETRAIGRVHLRDFFQQRQHRRVLSAAAVGSGAGLRR